MLQARSRLSREEFPKSSTNKVLRGELLTIRLYKADITKISVVISKKTLKMAHERHAVKRRIYAVFEDFIKKIPTASYIIFPNKGALIASQKLIKTDIEGLFKNS